MSGFFSSLRGGNAPKTPKEEPEARTLNETSEIYTTPLEGVKPTKKWEYDQEQLKKVCQYRDLSSSS